MNMKEHMLAAMQEQFDRWEELLAAESNKQIDVALLPSEWSIKDIIAHLMAWQQRSTAHVEAVKYIREPVFPGWPAELNLEDMTDQINDWIYKTYRQLPWASIHQNWKEGYRHFLESLEGISEKDLLNSEKTPWLKGYSLADVLLGSYDHHQEHLENWLAWLEEHGKMS
jgi:hypothetical protein